MPRAPWPSMLRTELLSGLVIALALVPEALSFSIIAGVDPEVTLYASVIIAVIVGLAGGRPAMISAATGSMALVVVALVETHGLQYLLAATVLTGVIQVALGVAGVGRLMRFIPRTVMTGFVNSLAILIFVAQLDHVVGENIGVWLMAAAGIAIVCLFPRLTTRVPAPLVAIAAIAAAASLFDVDVPTVGDMGALPTSLPGLAFPDVPFSLDTLRIIAPYSFTLAFVGLLESLLTAQLIDEITDTTSDKNRESRGQGIANVATGFFGGMAGCALIGQSMMNVREGGARTRISTISSGVFLLVLLLLFGDIVAAIPVAALVAVMIMVCVNTFEWSSVRPATLRRAPRSDTAVTVVTVALVVVTHNLAIGVGAGVVLAAIFFARRVAHVVDVTSVLDPNGQIRVYVVTGELFFASTNEIVPAFDYADDVQHVVIDLTDAHIWDSSAVASLDTVTAKFAARGITTEIVGLNAPSAQLHARLSDRVKM